MALRLPAFLQLQQDLSERLSQPSGCCSESILSPWHFTICRQITRYFADTNAPRKEQCLAPSPPNCRLWDSLGQFPFFYIHSHPLHNPPGWNAFISMKYHLIQSYWFLPWTRNHPVDVFFLFLPLHRVKSAGIGLCKLQHRCTTEKPPIYNYNLFHNLFHSVPPPKHLYASFNINNLVFLFFVHS